MRLATGLTGAHIETMADGSDTQELDPAATDATGENARDGARKRRSSEEPAAVVGFGASAGGIAPLQQFFADMDPASGLAFVVVMHLSPEHESNLASVIQQRTKMPVTQVNEPVKVRPNHVYVIPPNKQLTFTDSTLELIDPQKARGRRVTIDLFFRTLAQSYGQRAVCVILSGSDSDGVIGLKHVRAQGGVTIAQDPNEAEHDSMPASAISTGMVDWVLPVAQMAPKLLDFVRNENRMQLPPEIEGAEKQDEKVKEAPGGETVSDETRSAEDETALGEVLAHLDAHTGHDFAHYKRATILRRIARRLQVNSVESIPQYLEFLRKHPAEVRALLQDLLIGVTHFFRDQEAFAALEANLPLIFANKNRDDTVRVWVAGCATGEEAYSVAILLSEHADRLTSPPKIQVFASDIDAQAIQDARDAIYPTTIEADVSLERLRQFFVRHHGHYQVHKALREMVLFAVHDVLKDAPFSRVDLVSCRNLLIYLKEKAQDQVFDVFHFALRAGGLLFIGGAEGGSAAQSLFSPVDAKQRIYLRRSIPRPAWQLPILPLRTPAPSNRGVKQGRPRRLPALSSASVEEATTDRPAMIFDRQERRAVLFGELHLKLLEEYGPPSAVVNEEHNLVHLSESAGRYLQFVAGEPSANVIALVQPELRVELRTALFRAAQTNESVKAAPIAIAVDSAPEVIALEVRPVRAKDSAHGYFLILFQKVDTAPAEPAANALPAGPATTDLEDEIQFLKQQLNATVEQYEGTSEELKASNEELQAMNEEMRSATEELETSKEELQSVNEELVTVNNELKNSVEELSRTNADLNNLMASTDIATIFLDRQLRIQRFTPSAQKIFNLIPADLGRPLADITHRLTYPGLISDAEQVLSELRTMELEVRLGNNNWFLTRLTPYRTQEDRIAGVAGTFIDITRLKRAEAEVRDVSEKLEAQANRFDTIMGAVPDFVYEFDLQGRFTYISQSLLDLWGKTAEESLGKKFGELDYTAELAAKLQRQIEEVIETRHELKDETPYTSAIGSRMYEYLFFPLLDDDGRVEGVAGVTRDITDRKEAEEALRDSEARFRTMADNIPPLIWTNDANGEPTYFNRRWYEYTGLSQDESQGPKRIGIVHPEDATAATKRWERAMAAGEVYEMEYRLRSADGNYRWFIGRNVPLRDDAGRVISWFGSATDIDDLKKAERELRSTEERFRLLVEGARDYAMFLLDPDNKITFWSNGAERVFGWTQDEAVGQSGAMIFTPEDRKKGEVEKEIQTATNEGRALDRRFHLQKKGTRLWTDGVLMRIDDENGKLRGFAKVARDASDQRRVEDELAHARDEMEQRVVERTRELLAMNNELERTMQQRQQLERELLEISEREKRRIGEDLHDMVCQELTATALFLKSTATKLRGTSRAAAQTLEESAVTVNRNVVIARELARGLQAVELTAVGLKAALRDLAASACQNTGIKCHFKAARGVRVKDDTAALHLYRVAQEAVTNAVKHSGAKNILISLDRSKTHLCVSVLDDGKGFTVAKRRKGLGLHMMRYRANALAGELKIERLKTCGMDVTC